MHVLCVLRICVLLAVLYICSVGVACCLLFLSIHLYNMCLCCAVACCFVVLYIDHVSGLSFFCVYITLFDVFVWCFVISRGCSDVVC